MPGGFEEGTKVPKLIGYSHEDNWEDIDRYHMIDKYVLVVIWGLGGKVVIVDFNLEMPLMWIWDG